MAATYTDKDGRTVANPISSPQRYRLLKDLPGYKAGTIVTMSKEGVPQVDGKNMDLLIHTIIDSKSIPDGRLLDNPDWFAPVPADQPQGGGRWRAERGQDYWQVLNDQSIRISTEGMGSVDHDALYQAGNYFPTRETAEAAAEAIRAVLAYIQTVETQERPFFTYDFQLMPKINQARDAVQNHTKDKEE